MSIDFFLLPKNLPIPNDDGAAAHLAGLQLPKVTLVSTNEMNINIGELTGRRVIYIYLS
jgi:hypothetical protein